MPFVCARTARRSSTCCLATWTRSSSKESWTRELGSSRRAQESMRVWKAPSRSRNWRRERPVNGSVGVETQWTLHCQNPYTTIIRRPPARARPAALSHLQVTLSHWQRLQTKPHTESRQHDLLQLAGKMPDRPPQVPVSQPSPGSSLKTSMISPVAKVRLPSAAAERDSSASTCRRGSVLAAVPSASVLPVRRDSAVPTG